MAEKHEERDEGDPEKENDAKEDDGKTRKRQNGPGKRKPVEARPKMV